MYKLYALCLLSVSTTTTAHLAQNLIRQMDYAVLWYTAPLARFLLFVTICLQPQSTQMAHKFIETTMHLLLAHNFAYITSVNGTDGL